MGRGGDFAQVIHPEEMQLFKRLSNNMPTLITRCHLLLGCGRRGLGRTLIAQKSFRQSAAIFDDEYRIWKESV
jgi:Cdc6-like AAA superfamily ATPase